MRFCYLFKVRSETSCDEVKRNLEDVIGCPGGIQSVVLDKNRRYFRIAVDDEESWKTLIKLHKLILVEGKPAVIIWKDKILDKVTLRYNAGLMVIADEHMEPRMKQIIYDDVTKYPVMCGKGGSKKSKTAIETKSLKAAFQFDKMLQKVLFEDDYLVNMPLANTGGPYFPNGDNARFCTSIMKPEKFQAWHCVQLKGYDTYHVEIGCGDILDQDVEVIILPTHRNFQCIDDRIEREMRQRMDELYFDHRAECMSTNGNMNVGEVVPIRIGSSVVKAIFILHVYIDTTGPAEQLDQAYGNSLTKVNELCASKVAFFPFLMDGEIKQYADAAGRSIMNAVASAVLNLTAVLRFVHYDRSIADRFGRKLSEYCDGAKGGSRTNTFDVSDSMKYDQAMALPTKPIETKDGYAAVAQWLEDIDLLYTKPKISQKQRQYGKRSEEEKKRHKKLTTEQLKRLNDGRVTKFMEFLTNEFPPQDICHICREVLDFPCDDKDTQTKHDENTEICQRCYRIYHVKCWDDVGLGTCPTCILIAAEGDQLEGGKMTVRIVDSKQPVPGYDETKGHIEITYSIPSGLQATQHPAPGEFCYGIDRVAYLPNTEQGGMISDLLRVLFERGMIFCIAKSMPYGDAYGMTWNVIPHKTKLTGGRVKGGYPDETYLSRVERVLKRMNIKLPSKGLSNTRNEDKDDDETAL